MSAEFGCRPSAGKLCGSCLRCQAHKAGMPIGDPDRPVFAGQQGEHLMRHVRHETVRAVDVAEALQSRPRRRAILPCRLPPQAIVVGVGNSGGDLWLEYV